MSEDNKEDESNDTEANVAVEEQLRRLNKSSHKMRKLQTAKESPKLAAAINKMWVSQADEDKTKGRLKKYLRPENLHTLVSTKSQSRNLADN